MSCRGQRAEDRGQRTEGGGGGKGEERGEKHLATLIFMLQKVYE